jgi:hypothetical protein
MSDNTVSDERIAAIRLKYHRNLNGIDGRDIGDLLRALDQRTAERDAAAATERAAVVAYLNSKTETALRGEYFDGMIRGLESAVEDIEEGYHLK